MEDYKVLKAIGLWVAIGIIGLVIGIAFIPSVRAAFNLNRYEMQKVDDQTTYEARKRVEDEARMMIASYITDKARYENYKTSSEKSHLEWAEQAKMRANQTATTFNEFILKNSFVFKGNVPSDINFKLSIID